MAEGVELLAVQMETYLSTITRLIETEDSAALTNVAHSVRGVAATFGLQAIAALAKTLEEIAARSDFSGCRALATLLRSAVQRDLNKARELIAQPH